MNIVEHMQLSDVESTVRCHLESFPNFFLTTLGGDFLATYYSSCLQHPNTIALCAKDDSGNVVAFAIGTTLSKGYHASLIRHNFLLYTIAVLKIIFKRPSSLFRLYMNLNKKADSVDLGSYGELLSIAVLPRETSKGLGGVILSCFEAESLNRGVNTVSLTTDKYNNERTLKFYFKNGYECYAEFVAHPKREMYRLIKRI